MKNMYLISEIICFHNAKKSFNFPIVNSIRTSFWLFDAEVSTFSEIQLLDTYIEIWKLCKVQIMISERNFLFGKIIEGQDFKLGTFPYEIAYGRILSISSTPVTH